MSTCRKYQASQMRLYEHSARCPSALQAFLDCNPAYWCFIPLRWEDAVSESFACLREQPGIGREAIQVMELNESGDPRIHRSLRRVPVPPAAYEFSYRQRQQQRVFFEQLVSLSGEQTLVNALDLYKFAIVAVCKYALLLRCKLSSPVNF